VAETLPPSAKDPEAVAYPTSRDAAPEANGPATPPLASSSSSDSTAPDVEPGVPGRGFSWVQAMPLVVVVAVLCWAYSSNLRNLIRVWNQDPNYSHGYLVVPVALFILWRRWGQADLAEMKPAWWGWVLLVVVLASRAVFYERGTDWLETATFLPVLACLAIAAGGWPLLRRAWPAIAFLIFLMPLPQGLNGMLSQPLQRVATLGSSIFLKLSGLWVATEGNRLLVGADSLEVAAACNGLSMLMCLAATVVAMTMIVDMAFWKQVALIASIVPIALLSNVLRIAATAWCYHLFGAAVGGHFAHDAAGWLMMPLALVLVGLELSLLSWLIISYEEIPVKHPGFLHARSR
jgi:exosortase